MRLMKPVWLKTYLKKNLSLAIQEGLILNKIKNYLGHTVIAVAKQKIKTYMPNRAPPRCAAWSKNFQPKRSPALSSAIMAFKAYKQIKQAHHVKTPTNSSISCCFSSRQAMKRFSSFKTYLKFICSLESCLVGS